MGRAKPEVSVIHLLRRAERCALIALQERAQALDLTPTQIIVMIALANEPGLSQTRLCRATGIDRSTMADVVRRLVKKGIARRARTKQDARTYAVELSEDGHVALEAAVPVAAMAEQDLLAVLPGGQRHMFKQCLQKIVEALGTPEELHLVSGL